MKKTHIFRQLLLLCLLWLEVKASHHRTDGALTHHSPLSEALSSSAVCPSMCTCKWKNGKKTASCINMGLVRIPEGLESDTQVLHLHDNNFSDQLSKSVFADSGLTSLQRIYLSRCKITSLGDSLFTSLTNLVELDLSDNLLDSVPSESFKSCPQLRRLTLSGNPLKVIDEYSFPDLESLIFLDLNNCQLDVIDPTAFMGLKSLRTLLLSGNHLKVLPGSVIEPLGHLQELNLFGNPWMCDCSLRDLRLQMIQRNIPLSYDPTCHSPARVKGSLWSSLAVEDFSCPPSLAGNNGNVQSSSSSNGVKTQAYQKYLSSSYHSSSSSSSSANSISYNPSSIPDYIQVTEGDDASLECSAESVPLPVISWSRNGQSISNLSLMSFGRQMYLIKEEIKGPHEKSSKLIIINSLPKDSGRYYCNVSNKAGSVGKSVSLDIIPKKRSLPDDHEEGSFPSSTRSIFDVTVWNYSGETVAGVIVGLLIVLLVIFLVVVYILMRYKESVAAQVTGGGGEAANSTTYGTLTGNGSAIMPPQIAVDGVVDGHATVLVMYDMNQGKYATLKATTRNGNAHLVPNGQLPTVADENMLITSGVD